LPGRPIFRGGRTWLASPDGKAVAKHKAVDATLVQALRRGHTLVLEHRLDAHSPVLARGSRGIGDPYSRTLGRLAYLAPDIQAALISGEQPAGLTLERLLNSDLPISWSDQRAVLGFGIP
jgi:hypothetical protein